MSVTCPLFSPGPQISSTNKTDCHDITEILVKVVLNSIKQALYFQNGLFNVNYFFNIYSSCSWLSYNKLILKSHVILYVF
jgi:hypothetical protein